MRLTHKFLFLIVIVTAAMLLFSACPSNQPGVTETTSDTTSTSVTSDPGSEIDVTAGSKHTAEPTSSASPEATADTTGLTTDDPGTPTPEPTPTVEPTPTPIPTPTPTPVPAKGSVVSNTPEPDAGVAAGTQEVFYYNFNLQNTTLMKFDLQYSRYAMYSNYVVFLKSGAPIYSDVSGYNIAKSTANTKYPLVLKTTDSSGTVWLGFYMGSDYPPPTPTPKPTPTPTPTAKPTETAAPTEAPTDEPTEVPSEQPTEQPTEVPTEQPTEQPTAEATATAVPDDGGSQPSSSSKSKFSSPYGVDMSKVAFVKASDVAQRCVNYYTMFRQAEALRSSLAGHKVVRVSNYRNANGKAPLHNGNYYDAYGTYYHQCAPAYYSPSRSADFRYFMDGEALIFLYATPEGFTAVSHPKYGGTYFVPSYYLVDSTDKCTKVIVVDVNNQNQAALEYRNGSWTVLAVSYCTSGGTGGSRLPTDPGWFRLLDKLYSMDYTFDNSSKLEGYAMYALRFNGGAFVHGVPTDFWYYSEWSYTRPDPIEYDQRLGTIPLSHKCVRSATSYVKFLYNWATTSDTCVIITK